VQSQALVTRRFRRAGGRSQSGTARRIQGATTTA
jgi:hypothetical protein